MNLLEVIAANKKSALEQVAQDERSETFKAEMQADAFLNSRPRRHYTFIGEHNEKYEALQDIQRENVEASEVKINCHE